ncbi:MAG: amidohydrolase family protein [Candidatus Lokiarchaeota archaeon]|nr:amidohydrolase family protein [Candidatus Lokiarchaeota archaeon]MBD3338903.1 amidohydrolase family protein [Candidatus Lokiarchaeota archaeon]
MTDAKKNSNFLLCLFFATLLISILAWITYASLEGVLGTLAFIIIGFIAIYPWVIPIIGIILGILDLFGFLNLNVYETTLNLAHVEASWITYTWFWIVSIFGIILDLIITLKIISKIRRLKKKKPKKNLALINCHIFDGDLNSELIHDGVILVKNEVNENEVSGLIEAVGAKKDVSIPKNYKIIDLKSMYVLPGLINAHCHIFGSGKPTKLMEIDTEKLKKLIKLLETPIGKFYMNRAMRKHALTALYSGVTTLRSMGEPLYFDIKLRKKIQNGEILGPRILCAGMGICPTGGHGEYSGYAVDSKGEIRKAVRKNIRNEVDHIKILSTGGVMDARMIGEAGRPQMTVEEINIACFEAHRGNLLIATHCESTEGMKEALKGGVDTIEHGAEITDDLIPLFKNNPRTLRGFTAIVPTISAGMGLATLSYKDTKITKEKFENAKIIEVGMIKALQRAYKEGLKFGVGTDASVPYVTHYDFWKELKYLMKYTGMSAKEAIYYATKNNAEIIGIGLITGSIEEGKFADLILVSDNPLDDINQLGQVEKVMIKGYLINNPKVKKFKKLKEIEPLIV